MRLDEPIKSVTRSQPRILAGLGAAAGCLAFAAVLATTSGRPVSAGTALAAVGHAVCFLLALALLFRRSTTWARTGLGLLFAVVVVAVAVDWAAPGGPAGPAAAITHVYAGLGAIGLAGTAALSGSRRWSRGLVAACIAVLAVTYSAAAAARGRWEPPTYDGEACYRFLTATSAEQADAPLFPSAVRLEQPAGGCEKGGCHPGVHASWSADGHAGTGKSMAFGATLADFERRRGAEAGRWCRGCHVPESLRAGSRPDSAAESPGIACVTCHRVTEVHALFGSAAVTVGRGEEKREQQLGARLMPQRHRGAHLRPALHGAAELCAGCHRKHWNLPQNGYRWLPGPDEYRDWQTSRFSGSALLAAGTHVEARSCTGCHPAHGTPQPSGRRVDGLRLDAFLRSQDPADRMVQPLGAVAPRAGMRAHLDVVVANEGIGHSFPTGMPDLWDCWLEAEVLDEGGRPLRTGPVGPEKAHAYRLVALDAGGERIRHGNLDQMRSVREWRRIPAGGVDLARFEFTVPPGVKSVAVRLLRRRRPDFAAWAGEPTPDVEVLAERSFAAGGTSETSPSLVQRWRRYGEGLASVRSYPEAIQALRRARDLDPADPETMLALGRVYLEEGDLLGACEQFASARTAAPLDERPRAWEGSVLRLMGQPEHAARLLEPLARKYPRDLRVRFELGLAYLAQLRNREAAREFEAMLAVDPMDVGAHYNLMVCLQRQNRLTEARREEVVYRLLAQDGNPTGDQGAAWRPAGTGRPLRVYPLEARR